MGIIASSRLRAEAERIKLIGQVLFGNDKYQSIKLANNGKLYAVPRNASQVLEIDPVNQTTVLIGQDLGTASNKYIGLELANNGKLYAAPSNASQVLEIDPINQTTALIGQVLSGNVKYINSELANNGKLYAVPFNAPQVLEINP